MFGDLRLNAHGMHRGIVENLLVLKWRSIKRKDITIVVSGH